MGLAITDKTIDKYFGFLQSLDEVSKKRLITKLTASLKKDKFDKKIGLKDLSGAWQDNRESDEIIDDIRKSRVEKNINIGF